MKAYTSKVMEKGKVILNKVNHGRGVHKAEERGAGREEAGDLVLWCARVDS